MPPSSLSLFERHHHHSSRSPRPCDVILRSHLAIITENLCLSFTVYRESDGDYSTDLHSIEDPGELSCEGDAIDERCDLRWVRHRGLRGYERAAGGFSSCPQSGNSTDNQICIAVVHCRPAQVHMLVHMLVALHSTVLLLQVARQERETTDTCADSRIP